MLLTPETQEIAWIASSAGYAILGMLTTAIGAMFAYGKVLFDKLHNSLNQTIDQQKAQIAEGTLQIKELRESRNARDIAAILQARIEVQEKMLEHARDEQVQSTEKRFRELLEQNIKVITAIYESTAAVKAAAQGDIEAASALSELNRNVQESVRIQEDLRKKLESMIAHYESKGR